VDSLVFFADVLGFSELSRQGASSGAARALDDIALLFSDHQEIAQHLNAGSPWTERYGLSDSIVLLALDPVAAVTAASEFFFDLAWLNVATPEQRVLMRGSITRGDVKKVPPIFKETGTANVIGEAVVRAVLMEKSGAKGPRLLIDDGVAHAIADAPCAWLIDRAESIPEVLWLLPVDPTGDLFRLRAIAEGIVRSFLAAEGAAAIHYVAYVDLLIRSLTRLRQHREQEALALVTRIHLDAIEARLEDILSRDAPLEHRALRRLRKLRV